MAETGKNKIEFYFKTPSTILIEFLSSIAVLAQSDETNGTDCVTLLVGDRKIKIYRENLKITKISDREIKLHGRFIVLQEEW